MKIMIIGGGGREHALGWALAKSEGGRDFYFLPGNGGTISIGHNIKGLKDHDSIIDFAKKERIEFTVVGPEKPLVDGIVDRFNEEGLSIFGPSKEASQLEGSKAFAKEVMQNANVPTAAFEIFDDFNAAKRYIEKKGAPFVIKADGLAGGKGVVVCSNKREGIEALEILMLERKFGESGEIVIIEDCLSGIEVSVLALVSGDKILPFIPSQDHKQIYDKDKGPNTGGMGAYAPVPFISGKDTTRINKEIFTPTINELKKRGIEYKGVLYAGLMLTKEGPEVLEFNVRFGDPETQAILPLLNEDFLELLLRTNEESLPDKLDWNNQYALAVVLASGGYPGAYEKGFEIVIRENDCILFHAGTKIEDRVLYTNGGRVLSVIGVSDDLEGAKQKAYQCIKRISFKNMFYRKDIGDKGIKPL